MSGWVVMNGISFALRPPTWAKPKVIDDDRKVPGI
jgi:hypothetical protein